MEENLKKNIDESWKEAADKEKETLKKEGKFIPKDPDFNFFVTTLAIQASISMGIIPNPANNQKEQDLPQAKFLIDTLSMLQEKTKGNLTEEETKLLENLLYELRMQFISMTEAKPNDK
jgi:uncharacterized protein YjaG (DUF416 family)